MHDRPAKTRKGQDECQRCQQYKDGKTYHFYGGFKGREKDLGYATRVTYRNFQRLGMFFCRDCARLIWVLYHVPTLILWGLLMLAGLGGTLYLIVAQPAIDGLNGVIFIVALVFVGFAALFGWDVWKAFFGKIDRLRLEEHAVRLAEKSEEYEEAGDTFMSEQYFKEYCR